MGRKVIRLLHKIDGTPTELEVCEFGSPEAIDPPYGVRLSSTHQVVVADATALDIEDTGEYSATITGLNEGEEYEYYLHLRYGGDDQWRAGTFTAGPDTAAIAAGLYATERDLDDLRGSDNIASWSDLNNSNQRIHSRIQRAFNVSDARIQAALERLYVFPLSPISSNDAELLKSWSVVMASYELYRARGQRDGVTQSGRIINLYAGEVEEVKAEMWMYANGKRHLTSAKNRTVSPIALGSEALRLHCITGQRRYWEDLILTII